MAKRKRRAVDRGDDGELIGAVDEATGDEVAARETKRDSRSSTSKGATSTGATSTSTASKGATSTSAASKGATSTSAASKGATSKGATSKGGTSTSAASKSTGRKGREEPPPPARTRAQQRRLEASGRQGSSNSLWYILGAVAVVVAVVAAIVGIVWAEGRTGDVMENRPVEASGVALVPIPETGADPAVGVTAPQFKGQTFTGEPVEVTYPAVVMVVAHWCVHCQKEVPAFAPIVKDLQGPVKVQLISSGVTPGQSNYPPSKWLDGVKWPHPIADDVNASATKVFGVSGYPGFIAVGADGKVRARAAGEIGEPRFRQLLELAGMSEADAKAAQAGQATTPGAPSSPSGIPVPAPGAPTPGAPTPGAPAVPAAPAGAIPAAPAPTAATQ